jgi:nucleotide-binding universal stress UspA family protein
MTRRQYMRFAAVALWVSQRALGSRKEEFLVIVHPSNRFDALSRSKLSYLFLGKVSRWPWGAEAAPVDLAANEPIRLEFVHQALRMTEEQLAEYWIDQRATRGVSPPVEVRDAAAAKRWVAAKAGGIAYIPSSALDATVKAIRVDA